MPDLARRDYWERRALRAARGDGWDDPQPARVNHWRIRTDGLAVIYEAWFEDAEITARAFAGYVAGVFGVDPALVTDTTASSQYGPVVTLRYGGLDRLRGIMFGGVGTTWQQSRDQCAAYLAANAAAWGDV